MTTRSVLKSIRHYKGMFWNSFSICELFSIGLFVWNCEDLTIFYRLLKGCRDGYLFVNVAQTSATCLCAHSVPDVFLRADIWKSARIISTRPHPIYQPPFTCLLLFASTSGHIQRRNEVLRNLAQHTKNMEDYDLPSKDNACLRCSLFLLLWTFSPHK